MIVKNAMNLASKLAPQFSPYNPPVRLLPFESKLSQLLSVQSQSSVANSVTFSSSVDISPTITTFTLHFSQPVSYLPGQYVIIDFSKTFQLEYRHMAEENPKSINDDMIRSWTITSFPPFDSSTGTFLPTSSLTVSIKLKKDGIISPILHKLKGDKDRLSNLKNIRLIGFGGGELSAWQGDRPLFKKPLFIAAGVGVTPVRTEYVIFFRIYSFKLFSL